MATYTDKLADLAAMSLEDLQALETEITDAFTAADDSDDLDEMSSAADALDAVRAEISNKTESAEDPTDEAAVPAEEVPVDEAVAAAAVPGDDEEESPMEDDTSSTPEFLKKDEDEDKDAVTASGTDDAPASTEDNADAAVTASGNEEDAVDLPEDRQPVAAPAANTVITAGADIPGTQHGATFTSEREVAEAFSKRLESFRNLRGGDGEQVIVASVASTASSERQLDPSDPDGNAAKIKRVTSLDANEPLGITASGGYCAPLEVRYDIFGLGVADRPIKEALAGFQASRGGIRYTRPPVLSDLANAVGVWTAANDANPTSPTEKPCLKIACSPELTAVVDAVTMCLEIGNLQARAYPEQVSRNNELAMIQHARLGDLTLLSKIDALSTAVTAAGKIGFARDVLEQAGRAATAYRHRHRMGNETPLRVIYPAWIRDAIREDLTWGLPGDQLEWADSVIDGFFRTRKINVSWHLDDASTIGGAQAVGALNAWPGTFKWRMFAEGTFLFLDGGTLDLGIVRDGDLVGTNDYKMFVETFEGVAKIGIESLVVTSTVKVTGQVARHVPTTPEAEFGYDSTP